MTLFCFLWMPLFYLFWSSVAPVNNASSGGVWALLLGSVVALVQFFLGSFVNAGGFGFSRWVSACIDVVSLPAALPFIVSLLFFLFRVFSLSDDLTNFALLWLIPGAVIRAVNWSARREPILLVLAPLLWTAVAVGIPFFIRIIRNVYSYKIIFALAGIAVLPFMAATTYWAFFSQKYLLGYLLFFITIAPMGISVGTAFYQTQR
jgi:hypothetical protein